MRSDPGRPLGVLGASALLIGLALVMPLGFVLSSFLVDTRETWAHLIATGLPRYVLNTALLLLGVGPAVIALGVLGAWLVTAYRFPGRAWLQWALMLPLAMPAYVMAYAYTNWLEFGGPVQSALREWTGWQAREYWFPEIRSLGGAAAMLSFALYPYVYLVARTAFQGLSRSALEAGRLAGYGPRGVFLRVAVPLARPAIAAGAALALMEALADFGTVSYFAVEVLTTGIFRTWLSLGDAAAAAQLSGCLLGFAVAVLALERSSRAGATYSAQGPRVSDHPVPLRGGAAWLASGACAAPVFLGFGLPALLLIRLAWQQRAAFGGERLLEWIANSVSIGALTAALALTLALLLAYAARVTRNPLVVRASRLAGFGYAIPGAVIAVGVLVPLARFDNALADAAEDWLGLRTGLLLTGTTAALVYAYLVRLLAVALQSTEAGLARISSRMDEAARSLGSTRAGTLLRVHAPLLAPSLAAGALLVFVDVLKELPATFALRPFDFDTLAIAAHNLAADERLAEAAVPALVIVAVGLLPVVYVSRRYFQPARS